jgi:hypothetical protein
VNAIEQIADDGSTKRGLYARTLGNRVDLDIRVPFEHQVDMRPDDVKELHDIMSLTRPSPPTN